MSCRVNYDDDTLLCFFNIFEENMNTRNLVVSNSVHITNFRASLFGNVPFVSVLFRQSSCTYPQTHKFMCKNIFFKFSTLFFFSLLLLFFFLLFFSACYMHYIDLIFKILMCYYCSILLSLIISYLCVSLKVKYIFSNFLSRYWPATCTTMDFIMIYFMYVLLN